MNYFKPGSLAHSGCRTFSIYVFLFKNTANYICQKGVLWVVRHYPTYLLVLAASITSGAVVTDSLVFNFEQLNQGAAAWTSSSPATNTTTTWDFTGGFSQGADSSGYTGISQAYTFSGGSASLSSNTEFDNLAEDLSLELWIKPNNLSGGKQVLFTSGFAYKGFSLTLWDDTLHWVVKKGESATAAPTGDLSHTLVLNDITDYIQVVATIDNSGQMQLFVNPINSASSNLADASGTAGGSTDSMVGSNSSIRLGNKTSPVGGGTNGTGGTWDADQFSGFQGNISIFRAYDDVLTGSEVATNFNTYNGADTTAPSILSQSPATSSSDASIYSRLVLDFNEAVTAGSGSLSIYRSSDDSLVETIDVTSSSVTVDGSTVRIKASPFSLSGGYYVTVSAGAFLDLSNNAFAGLSGASAWSFTTASTAPAPNIIILVADDMVWRDCSPYFGEPGGHPIGTMPGNLTPHMQTLADEGIRFDTFQSTTALCAPFRQQLLTGIYPARSGALPNHGSIKDGTKSLPHHLQALDYRVALMGKRHINPASAYPFTYLGSGTDTEDATNRTAAINHIQSDPTKPYCLVITSNHPHSPLDNGDYVADNSTLPVTDDILDISAYRTTYNKYLKEVNLFDAEIGYWIAEMEKGPDPDNTIFICLTEHGANLPSTKYSLYEAGLRSGCIIRWPTQVSAGSSTDALVETVDVLPTLIEAVGGSQPTGLERLDGLSFLSLLKGQTDQHKKYAYGAHTSRGVSIPEGSTGSLEGFAIRSIRDDRYKLIWNLQPANEMVQKSSILNTYREIAEGTSSITVTTEERALAQLLADRHWARAEYQFFDLQADPFELNDIYDAGGEHSSRIADLKTKLENWMARNRDRGILTERSVIWHYGQNTAPNTTVPTSTVEVNDELHPFDAWIDLYPIVWHADRALTADPDGDGFSNYLEWIAGTNPMTARDAPNEACTLESITKGASTSLIELGIVRRRNNQAANLVYTLESSSTLEANSWQSASSSPQSIALLGDDTTEKFFVQVEENNTNTKSFYRVKTDIPADYSSGPALLFSGSSTSQSPTNLGNQQSALNNKNLTFTVQTTLPSQAVSAGNAELLWKSGGGTGLSLVMLGNQIVFTASTSSDSAALNLVGTLDPSDYGKSLTLRLTVEHKVTATLFNLSGAISGGSQFKDANVVPYNGYIGTASTRFTDLGSETSFPGLSNAPTGLLNTNLSSTANVLPWSGGTIQYEIIETVAAPIQ
jgi:uncharacterized sulfatase